MLLKVLWRWSRRSVFTRENAWALLLSLVFLLVMVMATSGTQPTFVYGNF